jgi:poly-gamma-glutamate synthesis protein (capsule biosynthesis protein)
MEWKKADSLAGERLVVWSLGNYVSNQRKQYTDGGAMVEIELEKCGSQSWISQTGFRLSWVFNPVENGKRQYYILPAYKYENDTMLLDAVSLGDLKLFLEDTREMLNKQNLNFPEIR